MNNAALPEGVEDSRPFQRRMWIAQRASWVMFALLLLLTVLGVFGRGGYFSRQEVSFPGGSVDIPVTARWLAPEELRITYPPSATDRTFVVDARFHELFSIESIDPAPGKSLGQDGRTVYVFPASQAHRSTVLFRLRTDQTGLRSYLIGIGEDVGEHTIILFP